MKILEALCELGVTPDTLSAAEKRSLDDNGFLIMPDVIPAARAQQMAVRLDEIAAAEGEAAGTDFHTETGATRLGTLVNKDPLFDICFLHPRALAAIAHIMGEDFGLSSITGRAAQPGQGHQSLHRDSAELAANALWMLDDFTPHNGPTRLVPGAHRFGGPPHELLADAAATHPEEIYLIAPAGTLVVINGATWHGGTRNNTAKPRHLVSAFFTPRGRYQSIARRRLDEAARERLSAAARFVFDPDEAAPNENV